MYRSVNASAGRGCSKKVNADVERQMEGRTASDDRAVEGVWKIRQDGKLQPASRPIKSWSV